MSLTIFKSEDTDLMLLQNSWSAQLNPVLSFPPINGSLLTGIALVNGITIINHKLGRVQQGWIITDITGAAQIYRSAGFNNLTLTLTSNAVTTVSLWVY